VERKLVFSYKSEACVFSVIVFDKTNEKEDYIANVKNGKCVDITSFNLNTENKFFEIRLNNLKKNKIYRAEMFSGDVEAGFINNFTMR
jgi:hypothetical protein